jgi:hypothetical protein
LRFAVSSKSDAATFDAASIAMVVATFDAASIAMAVAY